jgi:hypothetical protein
MPPTPEPIPAPDVNSKAVPGGAPLKMQKAPTNNPPRLQQPSGNDTMPPLPPEPALTPTANRAGFIQPTAPTAGYLQPVQQAGYQPPVKLPNVQPANFDRPMQANYDPRNQQYAAPIIYDAPPNYPATQAFYR